MNDSQNARERECTTAKEKCVRYKSVSMHHVSYFTGTNQRPCNALQMRIFRFSAPAAPFPKFTHFCAIEVCQRNAYEFLSNFPFILTWFSFTFLMYSFFRFVSFFVLHSVQPKHSRHISFYFMWQMPGQCCKTVCDWRVEKSNKIRTYTSRRGWSEKKKSLNSFNLNGEEAKRETHTHTHRVRKIERGEKKIQREMLCVS